MSEVPPIIALVGPSRAERAAVIRYLHRKYGYEPISFDDPLLEAAMAIYGFDRDSIEGPDGETEDPFWGISPADAVEAIRVDTEARIGEDAWLMAFERRFVMMNEQSDSAVRIVVDDVRRESEAELIRRLGGVLVRVDMGSNEVQPAAHCAELECDFATRGGESIDDLLALMRDSEH